MSNILSKEEKLILNDGVELHSTLWMPSEGGPWPALLMRQPYAKEIASTITYAHPHWWAKHGYLVVIQDVRGQGQSGGVFKGFNQESSDTSQTHKWIRSLPQNNGLLGTYGFSYQGISQLLADPKTEPPDCLAPAMTGLKECEHWSCEGGAFWWQIGLSWGLQLASQKLKREQNWDGWNEIRLSLENKTYLNIGSELLKKYDPEGMAYKWLTQSNIDSDNWVIHKSLKEWLKKPMLLIGGWWDPHLKGILDIYQQSINAGGHPELHIGPASHLNWWKGTQQLHLDFFNKHLKPSNCLKQNQTSKRIWNITNKTWSDSNEISTKPHYWGLSSQGLACIDTNDGELTEPLQSKGEVVLVHDPWRPCPSIGGHLGENPGIADRSNIDNRADVATFTTKPISKVLQIEGQPILEIFASSDQEGFDLFASLSIIDEDLKEVFQLSTGITRVLGNSAQKPILRKIFLQPIFAEIKVGTKIRLSLSAAAWPAIAINPGQLVNPPGPSSALFLVTTIYLQLEKSKLSICPVITK